MKFHDIWNGTGRPPSVTFVFSRQDSADVSQFSCIFNVKQQCPDGDEQEVNVVTSVKQDSTSFTKQATTNDRSQKLPQDSPTSNADMQAAYATSPAFCPSPTLASSGYFSLGYESLTSSLSLPEDTRKELMYLLDPDHPKADWRQLAERFGYKHKHIIWLKEQKSATLMLLHWLETRSPKVSMGKLAEALRDLDRVDAAEEVEKVLAWKLETLRETDV